MDASANPLRAPARSATLRANDHIRAGFQALRRAPGARCRFVAHGRGRVRRLPGAQRRGQDHGAPPHHPRDPAQLGIGHRWDLPHRAPDALAARAPAPHARHHLRGLSAPLRPHGVRERGAGGAHRGALRGCRDRAPRAPGARRGGSQGHGERVCFRAVGGREAARCDRARDREPAGGRAGRRAHRGARGRERSRRAAAARFDPPRRRCRPARDHARGSRSIPPRTRPPPRGREAARGLTRACQGGAPRRGPGATRARSGPGRGARLRCGAARASGGRAPGAGRGIGGELMHIFFVREAWRSFRHHRGLGMTAIFSLTATLTLSGLFVLLSHNADNALRWVGDRREMVIYLKDDVTDARRAALIESLTRLYGTTTYVSKEQAWKEFSEQIGDAVLLEAVGTNPLPSSLRVRLRPELLNAAAMEEAAKQVGQFAEVEDVRYGSEWVRRLDDLGAGLRRGTLAIGVLVALAIVFVIYNTLRLT